MNLDFDFNVKSSGNDDEIFGDILSAFIDTDDSSRRFFMYEQFLTAFGEYMSEPGLDEKINPVVYNGYITICPEPAQILPMFDNVINVEEGRSLFKSLLENRQDLFPTVDISERPPHGLWFNRTDNGINLRPGRSSSGDISPVQLGDQCVHGAIAGRTGSGKSVFLNVLLFNLLSEYPPWELDLFLADFKQVELSRYMTLKNGYVPHVNACAATGEIRYVVSLLSELEYCMKARQTFFKKLGFTKIADFRKHYSSHNLVLPRVLLLVDEFQQMFLDATNRESVAINDILTSITKLGRATGYHLLFASQEMSGTLGAKVFANFKARFALPCDKDVSAAILGNGAASELFEKGYVLVNIKSGDEKDNIKYNVPYISDDSDDGQETFFTSYLNDIIEISNNYDFKKIQKFYQEDYCPEINVIEKLKTSEKYIAQVDNVLNSSMTAIDSLILGTPVVYNKRKNEIDFETVFVECGKKKNIGAVCSKVDDMAYIMKLLAENFKHSSNASKYNHHVISRNIIINSIYSSIGEELGGAHVDKNGEDLSYIAKIFEENKKMLRDISVAELINERVLTKLKPIEAKLSQFYNVQKIQEGMSVKEIENIISDLSEAEDCVDAVKGCFKENMLLNFKNKTNDPESKDVAVQLKMVDVMADNIFNEKLIEKIDNAKRESRKRPIDRAPINVFWFCGLESIDGIDSKLNRKQTSSILEMAQNCSNSNCVFIFLCTSDENHVDFLKTCEYIFVKTADERIYSRYNLNYTKQTGESRVFDIKIKSLEAEKSVKKFRYKFDNFKPLEIDFSVL